MKNIVRLIILLLFKKQVEIKLFDRVGQYVVSSIEVMEDWDRTDHITIHLENAANFKRLTWGKK